MTKGDLILRNERVLVVDDIPKWLKVARDNLNYYGCTPNNIINAENIEEAFEKYQKQKPTLVLADINFDTENLKDTQGLSLIKRLRKNYYTNPIIAMSSLVGDIGQRTIEAGADYFIDKQDFVKGFDNFIKWYAND